MEMNRIKVARAIRKMKQSELANIVGIDAPKLSLIENGLKIPTYDQKKKIAEAFGYEIKDLWPSDQQQSETQGESPSLGTSVT